MLVFLDSCVICENYYMNKPHFVEIKNSATIVLSEIVIEETVNRYRKHLEECLQKINGGVHDFNKVAVRPIKIIEKDTIEQEVVKYKDFLELFAIESGMNIAPLPQIQHKTIVERALSHKKPFDKNGHKGYRDFLVWFSFLEVAKTYAFEEVHFITHNIKDFADESDIQKLHQDLINDINIGADKSERIHFWSSIKDFIEKAIKPYRKSVDEKEELKESFLTNEDGFIDPLIDFIDKELIGKSVDGCEVPLYGCNSRIIELSEIKAEEIKEISILSENGYLIEVNFRAESIIHSNISKAEIQSMSKKELKRIDIVERNFTSDLSLIRNYVPLEIITEVVFQKDVQSIKSIEISEVSDSTYCPYCPYNDDYEEDGEDE